MYEQTIAIVNQIASTNSRLEKENTLRNATDDNNFIDVMKFVYNNLISTGISKKKLSKKVDLPDQCDIKDVHGLMDYLKSNNTGSDKDIGIVQKFIDSLPESDREFIKSVVTKDLPIGISLTTLNKVYGSDFIPKYAVMSGSGYVKDKTEKFIDNRSFTATLKLDGNRITFFNHEDSTKGYTRSGKEVEGYDQVIEQLRMLPKGFVYDGEVVLHQPDERLPGKGKDFDKVQSIARKKGKKEGLDFIIFDMFPISEFESDKFTSLYIDRIANLKSVILDKIDSKIKKEDRYLRSIPILYSGYDISKIEEMSVYAVSKENEGIMININSSKYEKKRSKNLIKVKIFKTADLRVTKIHEEIRGGKCGSVSVNWKGQEVNIPVLQHKLQEQFWKSPQSILGKIIEVKYFEETQLGSLRLPSFVRVRNDKTEESYF